LSLQESYKPQKKTERIPGSPRVPQTAFFLFCGERRKEAADAGELTPKARELGIEWKSMGQDKREIYLEMASIDTSRFHIEKGRWCRSRGWMAGMTRPLIPNPLTLSPHW